MTSLIRDVCKIKLQLGYILFFVSVAAILFSAHRFIAPGSNLPPRAFSTAGQAKKPAETPAVLHAAYSSSNAPESRKPLSINAPQLASIQRYIDASARICSSQITSAIGTDPKLGIESDIAQWCGASHGDAPARCVDP